MITVLCLLFIHGCLVQFSDGSKFIAHKPNYCNNTELLREAGLVKTKIGQFLGFNCSSKFFHCRLSLDGFRTYKKECKKGLVYDTKGTQACNYEANVRGCGSSPCESMCPPESLASSDQLFTCCLSETCVKMSQRCDGIYDCLLEEDEHNCPTCGKAEFACVISEQCISIGLRCDGMPDCDDRSDESNCEACDQGKFYCSKSDTCIPGEQRCDEVYDCPQGEDESLCKYESRIDRNSDAGALPNKHYCGKTVEGTTTQLATTSAKGTTTEGATTTTITTTTTTPQSVEWNRVCDGIKDCPDGSDEAQCTPSDAELSAGSAEYYFYEEDDDSLVSTNVELQTALSEESERIINDNFNGSDIYFDRL